MIRLLTFDKFTSGITGIPILICGILIILITIQKTMKILKSDNPLQIGLNSIWLIGLICFLFRTLEQAIILGNMFDAMASAEELNTPLVYKGLGDLAFYSVSSTTVLIISITFWGYLKGLQRYKIKKMTQ